MFRVLFISTFFLVNVCVSRKLPEEIQKCRLSDPNLHKCLEQSSTKLLRTLAKGSKTLGIAPMEPLHIEKIDLKDLKPIGMVYENVEIWGLIQTDVLYFMYDDENCFWNGTLLIPELKMHADYALNGQFMVFQMNGHGKFKLTMNQVTAHVTSPCEKFTKSGKKHYRVTSPKLEMFPKNAFFDIENVIDGNEELSKEVMKIINEDSVQVYKDLGKGMDQAIVDLLARVVNSVGRRFAINELFDS